MTENKRFTINMEYECIDDVNNEIFINFNDRIDFYKLCEFLNKLNDENEQLKQRCKELRNDLIDHSALVNMLEQTLALSIEDIIWNTMEYKTQTEFDDDFTDYMEDAKKRWKK